MGEQIVYFTICLFLAGVFVAGVRLAAQGDKAAKYFLWAWAGLLVASLPLTLRINLIPSLPAGMILAFLVYVMVAWKLRANARLEVSHEETRRVLAESNRRIDDERRTIARRLHDEVNPNLVLSRSELKRLEPYLAENERALKILASVDELITDAYAQTRDVIKNTRIELIDAIGFTAAVESLVSHFRTFCDKPSLQLTHNLTSRPEIEDHLAVTAYKLIREAVFNAIKHAGAEKITVTLHQRARGTVVDVTIEDDGVGLSAKPVSTSGSRTGIGLIDMRERARAIGAELKIEPNDKRNPSHPGTRISFSFAIRSS